MGVVSRVLLLFAAVVCLTACGTDQHQTLDRWTLFVAGETDGVEVQLPTHLDDRLPNERVQYELRTEVDPGSLRDQELILVLPHFEGLAELHVNGHRAEQVQYEPIEEYRHAGPHVWHIPQAARDAPQLELSLLIDHRWMHSGWLDTVPRLRPEGRIGAHALAILLLNNSGANATLYGLLLIGLMALWVYLSDRRRNSYLWFSLQLLSAAYYPLHVSGFSQALLGVYDTVLLVVALNVALMASVRYTLIKYGGDTSRQAGPWMLGIGVAVVSAVLCFDPFWMIMIAARVTVLFLAAVIGFQIIKGVRLLRRDERPRGARVHLASWLILGGTSALDGVAWFGLGEPLGGIRAAGVGLGAFALLSSMRLMIEHVHTLGVSDELNQQLARRVEALETKQREVEDLNGRLRDQMSHRSRQLFAMLSQLPASGNAQHLHLDPGDMVNDRYRVIKELGAGGMGVVYAVLRQADEMRLALKVTMQGDAWGLARLAREAEIAMLVDHPNVVSVVDVDIDPRRGFLYMVMEHVDGPSLGEYKQGFGRDKDWALDVLHQLSSGLASLHAAGVVHRDLKPANVLLVSRDDGEHLVKLTDFGISRTLDAASAPPEVNSEDSDVRMPIVRSSAIDPATRRLLDAELRGQAAEASLSRHDEGKDASSPYPKVNIHDESTRELRVEEVKELELWEPSSPLTQAGCIVGTPVFMAPELALDPPLISPAADIFSFGVMAHQLLTGRRPFAEPPVITVAEGRSLPPEMDLHLKQIPAGLRATLRACLSVDPDSRPGAARLAEVFRDLIEHRQGMHKTGYRSRPFPTIKVGDHEVRERDPDAPAQREHDSSPPEPHAA